MRLRSFIACLASALLGPASTLHAQDQAAPLFAAFKTYCLDAGVDPDQVRMAVEVAGGKVHVQGASTSSPWPMTMQSWDIIARGHRMILTIGTAQQPEGQGVTAKTTNCTIHSYGGDESASLDALRKWRAFHATPAGRLPNSTISGGRARSTYPSQTRLDILPKVQEIAGSWR